MRKAVFFVLVLALAATAAAQNNELAVAVGGYIPVNPGSGISLGHAIALQGNFAHRLGGVPFVSAYLEIPVVGGFNTDVVPQIVGTQTTNFVKNYSSLFITPGLKVKLAAAFPISPYFVGDVGLARFKGSSTLAGGSPNPTETVNKFAFAFGGGLDMKVAPWVSLRGEVRDFYTGVPSFTNLSLGNLIGTRQHNVVPAAGLVLRF